MTFEDIWGQLLRKRPALAESDKVIEFRPAALKMLLEQVYDQGAKAGAKSPTGSLDPFESILGGRPR